MGKLLCSVLMLSLLEISDSVPSVLVAMAAIANNYKEFFI